MALKMQVWSGSQELLNDSKEEKTMLRSFKPLCSMTIGLLFFIVFLFLVPPANAQETCNYDFSWLPYTGFETARYEIHYGYQPDGPYPNVISIGKPATVGGRVYGSVTDVICTDDQYFVVVAVDSTGNLSDNSQEIKIVAKPANLHIVIK